MIIDINSKGGYPSNELSNFFPYEFILDGVKCASMEGFLQSLKYVSIKKQKAVCALCGKEAKKKGKRKFLWKLTGILHWQGKRIPRQGKEYEELLNRAYDALSLNPRFAEALKAAGSAELIHSCGKSDPRKTVLTTEEFISHLKKLR